MWCNLKLVRVALVRVLREADFYFIFIYYLNVKILRLLLCWEHDGAAIKSSEWHVLATQAAGAGLQRDTWTQDGGAMPMMIVQLTTNTKNINRGVHFWTWRTRVFLVQRLYRCVQSTSSERRPTWPLRKSTYSCCWLAWMTWVTTGHGYLEWVENWPTRSENDVGNYGPRLPGVEGELPHQQQKSGVGSNILQQNGSVSKSDTRPDRNNL